MMNSTLKPVLPSSSQNSSSTTPNKPIHPTGAPVLYGQPSGPTPQNPFPNTNMAHNHPSTPQNHFPLNVPSSGAHFNMGTIPASNHPIAISQPSGGQSYNPPKNVSYSTGFQHSVGQAQSQNTLPPVSQTLPATTAAAVGSQNTSATQNLSNSNSSANSNSTSTIKESIVEKDKPQSNGTTEVQRPSTGKPEVQGNHVTPQPSVSVAQPVTQPQENKPAPQVTSPQPVSLEKPKPDTSTKEIKATKESKPEQEVKLLQEPPKIQEVSIPTPPAPKQSAVSTTKPVSSVPQAAPSPIPLASEPTTAPVPPSQPVDLELVQNDSESAKDAPETDPLAIDSSATVPEEKPSQVQDAVPVIQAEEAKDESEGDDKSSEEQSTDETESEKGQKDEDYITKTPVRKTRVAKTEHKAPVQKSPGTSKTKRQRLRTQHYQSPLPEIEIITKITSSTPRNRNTDDKLIYFYKNEFLAVRNAEGGFYLCQAVQNVYKSSSKIKIRWLSQDKTDKSGEIYTPDFYDLTDFDCILTSLDLTRVGKGRYKLKPAEKLRTDSILKRCLAVEKGEITQPSISEEHPDGLDLSLYKDEEQLKKNKRRAVKRKGRPRSVSPQKVTPTKKSAEASKVRKVEARPSRTSSPLKKSSVVSKKLVTPEPKKVTPTTSKTARGKRKADTKSSPVVDQKKAKVIAKIGRKAAIPASNKNSNNSKPPTTKNTKLAKSTPSTSKVTKSTLVSKPPLRKAKRTGRK